MILGIDASNIRRGGGVTHLVQLLSAAQPEALGISKVIVWSGRATLDRIGERPWLVKCHLEVLDRGVLRRALWQRFSLSALARRACCDALFIPGGSFAGAFRPIVTLSQNLLPFEWRELRRYGLSWLALKFSLLRFTQGRTFRQANGLIFLTTHARGTVTSVINAPAGKIAIIPHGIDQRFSRAPRPQLGIGQYSDERPFRFLYVSIVDVYKHQWHVADAVVRLRREGLPVTLDIVGPAYAPALARLRRTLDRLGPAATGVRYSGPVAFDTLHEHYAAADAFIFASSCENLPNILLEAMASGLPIACSNRGPMPEVLGDAGVYFDPENPADIASALTSLVESPALRAEKAQAAFERSEALSWGRCAAETLGFIKEVADAYRLAQP